MSLSNENACTYIMYTLIVYTKNLKCDKIAPLLAYFLALTLIIHQQELNDNCAIHGCNMFIPTSQSVYGCGLECVHIISDLL
jgi:hypothetical protein